MHFSLMTATPGETDLKIIKKVKDSNALIEILVLNHIIVARDGNFLFADEGSL